MGRYDDDKEYQTGDYVLCTAGQVHHMITAPKPDKKVAPSDSDVWEDMAAPAFKDYRVTDQHAFLAAREAVLEEKVECAHAA